MARIQKEKLCGFLFHPKFDISFPGKLISLNMQCYSWNKKPILKKTSVFWSVLDICFYLLTETDESVWFFVNFVKNYIFSLPFSTIKFIQEIWKTLYWFFSSVYINKLFLIYLYFNDRDWEKLKIFRSFCYTS